MAYAAVTDIEAEFRSLIASTGESVTTNKITEWIAQEEAALNGQVGTIYTIPVTGTQGIAIMKLMTTLMVKARITDMLPVKTGTRPPDQGKSEGELLRERVDKMLEKIMKRDMLLPGAPLAQTSGGVSSYTQANDIQREVFKDEDNW